MARTDTDLAGTLLEHRYQVQRLLARGGMSAVYQGVDTRLGRPVAIKVMDPQFADDRSFVERFEREARSAAALHHPNVVAVHDQGLDSSTDEERVFLVMELVDGGTLRQVIDDHDPLDVHVALSVVEPVLSALAAAHEAGLVHRDIKPENVLIGHGASSGAETVKVADFGLVRAVASANTTSSSVILGTVAYLSPEQVSTGAATERGDVYSTGILLYELLTGSPPYSGDTALSVAYRHVNDDVPAPSTARAGIPPALDDLVLRATRRDPQARPSDAAALLAELRHLRAQLGIELVPVPIPASTRAEAPGTHAETTETAQSASERTVPAMRAVTGAVQPPTDAGPRGTRAMLRESADTGAGEPEPEPRRGHRGRWIALATVLALLLLGGAGGMWWLNARWIPVPDLAGMTKAEATQALRTAGLEATFTHEPHNTVPEGTVIRSTPGDDSEALPGDTVTVVLSAGRPVVPDIAAGTPPAKAERMIRQAQLKPRRDTSVNHYSTSVAQGLVITVRPKPGTEVDIGSAVTLVLSKGPPPTPVPELTGRTKEAAFEVLRNKGFEPFVAGKKFSEDVAGGRVIKTTPPAGTQGGIDGSMRVGVYISNAVQVPYLIGKSIDDAANILAEAGLQADFNGVLSPEGGHSSFGFVVGQSPSAGTRVEPGSTVQVKTLP